MCLVWLFFSGAACFLVEAATGDEPHIPEAHPDSNFCFTRLWDFTNPRFLSRCAFCLGTLRQCQETESWFTERIRNPLNIYMSDQGKLFFTQSCMLLLTLLQRCAPSFAQNRFVMYITHLIAPLFARNWFVMYITRSRTLVFVMYVTCYRANGKYFYVVVCFLHRMQPDHN